MQQLAPLVKSISDFFWNNILLFLLFGTGIWFTVRMRFIQVRRFGHGLARLFGGFSLNGKKADHEGMSSFQALTTAIAAQVGTGNIAGCAVALVSGGAGAIFWMWVSAFFGMATIYGEAVLAQTFRTTVDGQVTGGPIYYIRAVFKGKFGKFLAGFFSIAIVFALGFTGNMVQANSISDAFHNAFGLPKLAVGLVTAAAAAFIFLGGVRRIASFTEKVVPIMALFYIIGCTALLVINHEAVPEALRMIFTSAFSTQAVVGGAAGISVQQAMRIGVARGLFSNEAGMGSTPHAHALAKVKHPQEQGEIAMVSVFIDTFVILTLTAMVILTSGVLGSGATGAALAQLAFSTQAGEVWTGAAMECHQDITPETPSLAPCWRCTCLPVLTLEMQGPGDAVTSILPAGIRIGRESASLVRAVKSRPQGNPTPGRRRALSLSAMEPYVLKWAGEERHRPMTRECATDAAGGLPML